ncbi:MAG: hypothetical protein ACRETL_09445, partial [Gammaproteobacteria bacterium]
MGFDVKAAADSVLAAVEQVQTPSVSEVANGAQAAASQVGTAIAANPGSFISYTLAAIVLMSLGGIVWRVRRRLAKTLEDNLFANWRLTMLGTTGVVLSLASGYTTWDGMRNFTSEPLLSLMVTFGIQGVMLIVAWLIGESFAIGMNQQASYAATERRFGLDPMVANFLGAIIGIALFVALMTLFMGSIGQSELRAAAEASLDWSKFSNRLLLIVTGLLSVAFIAVFAASDLVRPYIQSARVIIR